MSFEKVPDVLDLLALLQNGIKKFGIARVGNKLKELEISLDGESPVSPIVEIRTRIMYSVAKHYGLTPRRLLYGKERGSVTEAKVMAIILFKRHLKYTCAEIGVIFGCGESVVYRRLKAFNDGNPKQAKKSDEHFAKIYNSKGFMESFQKIERNVEEFKVKMNGRE